MKSIFYLFFKSLRKLKDYHHRFFIKLRLFYYCQISKQRFVINPSIIIGKRFSINSDITATFIDIKDKVWIRNDFHIRMGNGGKLQIGENCFFNNRCSINCLGSITIGNDCQFGENVLLYDHNHQHADKTKLVSEQGYAIGSIKIGNNCWVGSNVVILKGVEIGDNVVIGAGCVIHQSIASDTVMYHQQNLVSKQHVN